MSHQEVAFALIGGGGLDGLLPLIQAPLQSAWVAETTLGFGPPVAHATPELVASRGQAPLERLALHIRVCLGDDGFRTQLLQRARARLVRQSGGPVEAEALEAVEARAFELALRLYAPEDAPPGVRALMRRAGVQRFEGSGEARSAQLRLRLSDPLGQRILHAAPVAAAAEGLHRPVALEMRVPVEGRALFQRWTVELEAEFSGLRVVDLGDPTSRVRTRQDGISG